MKVKSPSQKAEALIRDNGRITEMRDTVNPNDLPPDEVMDEQKERERQVRHYEKEKFSFSESMGGAIARKLKEGGTDGRE